MYSVILDGQMGLRVLCSGARLLSDCARSKSALKRSVWSFLHITYISEYGRGVYKDTECEVPLVRLRLALVSWLDCRLLGFRLPEIPILSSKSSQRMLIL